MPVIDIVDHFNPLDRSTLEGKDAYLDYFDFMKKALNALLSSFHNIKSETSLEINILKHFGQKILNSIEAFSLKYTFNEDHKMLIDLSHSGFPNFIEFKKLKDDLNRQSKELLKLESESSLKKSVLDHLLKKRTEPKRLLNQLGKVSYLSSIKKEELFLEFVKGELIELKKSKDSITYLYSWGAFDPVHNRPFIYLMVFENHLVVDWENTDIKKRFEAFEQLVEKFTNNGSTLNVIALNIDEADVSISPKILKRLDIGPIYGRYAQDNHKFNQLIKKDFNNDFIFTYNTEIVFSTHEKKQKSFLQKPQLRQVFYIDQYNKECMDKMISDINKYMITSHSVLQHLNEREPEVIKNLTIPVYVYK